MSWTFKYKVTVKAPLEEVWACFATLEGMKRWFMVDGVLEPYAGGRFQMIWDAEQRMEGRVTVFEPQKSFAFQWIEETLFANTTATFTFESLEDGRTRVNCTDGPFPEEIGAAKSFADVSEGWATCLMILKGVLQYGVDLRN